MAKVSRSEAARQAVDAAKAAHRKNGWFAKANADAACAELWRVFHTADADEFSPSTEDLETTRCDPGSTYDEEQLRIIVELARTASDEYIVAAESVFKQEFVTHFDTYIDDVLGRSFRRKRTIEMFNDGNLSPERVDWLLGLSPDELGKQVL